MTVTVTILDEETPRARLAVLLQHFSQLGAVHPITVTPPGLWHGLRCRTKVGRAVLPMAVEHAPADRAIVMLQRCAVVFEISVDRLQWPGTIRGFAR